MRKIFLFTLAALIVMTVLSGCADTSNIEPCLKPAEHTYGFWGGVWHGMIMVFSFIGSLFDDDIAVYAVNNNGAWYNFGFVGGLPFIIKVLRIIFRNENS